MTGRRWLGLGFVVATLLAVGVALSGTPGARTLSGRLMSHATSHMQPLAVRFEEAPDLRAGDPVYTVEDQAFALAGRVLAVGAAGSTIVEVVVDPIVLARFDDATTATAMSPGRGLGWVLRTLLPPPLREALLDDLEAVVSEKGDPALDALKGPVLALLGDVFSVLAETLPPVLAAHQERLDTFVLALRTEIYPGEIAPVVSERFVPALNARIESVASEIGAEIWSGIRWSDVWAMVWTGTKEKVGLAESRDVEAALGRLVRERALPVLERRGPELLQAALAAGEDVWEDPAARAAIDRAAWRILRDPRFQELAGAVARDWLLRNPLVADRFEQAFRSESIRAPIRELYAAAEPTLERYLEEMLTREDRKGMDHQLVRVLRSVVLKKDARYLLLQAGGGPRRLRAGQTIAGLIGSDP